MRYLTAKLYSILVLAIFTSLVLTGCKDAAISFSSLKSKDSSKKSTPLPSFYFANLSSGTVSNVTSPILNVTATDYPSHNVFVYSDACTTQIATSSLSIAGLATISLPSYTPGGSQDGLKQYWYVLKDGGGNIVLPCASTSASYTLDSVNPIISMSGPSVAYAKTATTVNYTVNYTDLNPVNITLTSGNITPAYTGTAGACSIAISGTGNSRTVSFTGCTGNGTVSFSIVASTASDSAGNFSTASGMSAAFTLDNIAPTITITSPTPLIGNSTNSFSYTVTYADANFSVSTLSAVTVNLDVMSGAVTCSGVAVSGSGTTRTVTISNCTGDGTVGISLPSGTAVDLAGNLAPVTGTSAVFTVDNTPPNLTLNAAPAYANIGSSPSFNLGGSSCQSGLTVSISATDGSFTNNASFVCAGGVWSNPISLNSPNNLGQVTITFTVSQTDSAGNTTSLNTTTLKDTVAPSIASPVFTLSGITNNSDSTIQNPTFNLSSADPNSTLALFKDSANCSTTSTNYSVSGIGTASAVLTFGTTNDYRYFSYFLTDQAGNISGCKTSAFTYWFVSTPVLSTAANYMFPTNERYSAQSVVEDFRNMNNPVGQYDHGMTYSCFYDRNVDGTVSAVNDCSTLLGTTTWNTTTGALNWLIGNGAFGPYEIQLTGTNIAGSSTYTFVVDVSQNVYVNASNLVYHFDAMFSRSNGGQGTNSSGAGSYFWDLIGGSTGLATFNSFSWNASSGWTGSLPATSATERISPYAIRTNGSWANLVNFSGTYGTFNSQANQLFDMWISPNNIATANAGILTNADSTKGIRLNQSKLGDGAVELRTKSNTLAYFDSVINTFGANLVTYYRLNEFISDSHVFPTIGAFAGVTTGSVTRNVPVPFFENSASMQFDGSTGVVKFPSNDLVTGANTTICAWVNPTTSAGSVRTIVAKDNGVVGQKSFSLGMDSSGKATFTQYNAIGTSYTATDGAAALTQNVWHFICGQSYNNGNTLYVWSDNNAGSSGSAGGPSIPLLTGTAAINTIGATASGTQYFSGRITDVMYFNSAISPSMVGTNIYTVGFGGGGYLCRSRSKMQNGSWHRVAGGYDAGNLKLYVDNWPECSIPATAVNGSLNNLIVGSDNSVGWDGQLASLKLYNASGPGFTATNYDAERSRFVDPVKDAGTMLFWYDAATIALPNASTVSIWSDSSGNGRTLAPTGSPTYLTGAINGKPAVSFSGASQSMATTAFNVLNRAGITLFVVGQHATPGTIISPFGIGSSTSIKFSPSSAAFTSTFGGLAVTDSNITSGGVPYVFTVKMQGGTSNYEAHYNGVNQFATTGSGLGNPISGTTDVIYVGTNGIPNYYNGQVAEVVAYDGVLSSITTAEIEHYFGRKYGIRIK